MKIDIEIKKTHHAAILPERHSDGAAGIDMHIIEDVKLFQGEHTLAGTGIAVHIGNPGIVGKVYIRSSLGKQGLVLGNGTGIIDSDYQGEIKLILRNMNQQGRQGVIDLKAGDRVAQMLFEPVVLPTLKEVREFGKATKRGTGGIGSTGRRKKAEEQESE